MGGIGQYATREDVMRAGDIKAAAYMASQIDDALDAGARAVDQLCHRGDDIRPGFAPWTGTITFNWPDLDTNEQDSYRFRLNQHSLLSFSTVTSGGTAITAGSYGAPLDGPPYSALTVDRSTSAVLGYGNAAGQRSLAVTGVWSGARLDEVTRTGWTLSGAISTTSATTATLNALFGVGSIVRIGSERMTVVERTWVASSQTGTLTSATSAQTLAVANGSAFIVGEEILMDAERMLVRDIVANNLIVQRQYAGSALAAHAASTPIFWNRSVTLERGALGTTAATHADGDAVYVYRAPALIRQLNVAYALDQRQQESSAYARTVGSGESERNASGRGIRDLEDRVLAAYGRQVRHRAV